MFSLRANPTRSPRPLAGARSCAVRSDILLLLLHLDRLIAGVMRRAFKQGVCRGGKAAPEQTVFDA